jgi:hypothetical protein
MKEEIFPPEEYFYYLFVEEFLKNILPFEETGFGRVKLFSGTSPFPPGRWVLSLTGSYTQSL